jgi:hypothetical protein
MNHLCKFLSFHVALVDPRSALDQKRKTTTIIDKMRTYIDT